MSASRNVTASLALCSLSLERPRPNPAICWLHPGEQKLIPADDPKHPAFPCEEKKSAMLRSLSSFRGFIMISKKHATCVSNNKCS